MSKEFYFLIMTLVCGVVTIALRAFPFVMFSGNRPVPPVIKYIGKVLAPAAIAMLVVYSLYSELNYMQQGLERLWSMLIASALTVVLQLFFRNPLVSILGGTACFMILIQRIFV
jgi:branched-subunit amino acid transport protein AzlD